MQRLDSRRVFAKGITKLPSLCHASVVVVWKPDCREQQLERKWTSVLFLASV